MPQYPYKKQVIAGDVPELKPFDYTRQLDATAQSMEQLSEKTAQMARANFLNTFEIESRQMLTEVYERNKNNPEQLLKEQEKARVGLLKGLPTKELRNEANVQFQIHAMPYLQKSKENLYRQEYEKTQAGIYDYITQGLNDIENFGDAFYSANPENSRDSLAAATLIFTGIVNRIGRADKDGNYYLTPREQAAYKQKLNVALTKSARSYYDKLPDNEKVNFAKEYEQGATMINAFDPENPDQLIKMNISKILDRDTYEENLAYFKKQTVESENNLLLEEAMDPVNNPKGDLMKAASYINRAPGYSLKAKKAAMDIVYAQISHNKQINDQQKEMRKINVLNTADGMLLNGNVAGAIKAVRDSDDIESHVKYEIIEKIKTGQRTKQDDPVAYNALAAKIVSGEIYQPSQVLEAYGRGQITDSSKNALIKTMEQVQEPSFKIYKQAQDQVNKVYNKGLMGSLTPAESVALSNINRELNEMYLQSLSSNKSADDMKDIFSPENVQRVAEKYAVGVNENVQSYMGRIQPKKSDVPTVPQRQQGESVDAYLQRVGGVL